MTARDFAQFTPRRARQLRRYTPPKIYPTNNHRYQMSKNYDILIYNKVYPDAKNLFRTPQRKLNDIKDDCLIVLDTNVLLIPYSISSEDLSKIKEILEKLVKNKRLFIPAQVAREFAKNRPNKLSTVFQQLSQKRAKIINHDIGAYPLLEGLDEYTSIKIIEEEINNKIKEYKKSINNLISNVKDWVWDDPVSKIYNDIFTPDIIFEPEINADSIESELDSLITHKLPPGYKDSSKNDKGIGDFLIWKTILQIASSYKKDLIFVTADTKADWWYQSEGMNLYPRYELVDEYRRLSDNKLFHMTSLSNLLELSGIDKEVIQNIKYQEDLTNADEDYIPVNVWKIGSRWHDRGDEEYSVLDIFKKYGLVFAGKGQERIEKNVLVGDYIAISDGFTIVAIGKVLDAPKNITEYNIDPADYTDRFHYEDWVMAIKVNICSLPSDEIFEYRRMGTFHGLHGEVRQHVINLYNLCTKKNNSVVLSKAEW